MSPSSSSSSPGSDVPSEAAGMLPSGPARLAFNGMIVEGSVLSADTAAGFVSFTPSDPDMAPPEEGESVRLSFGTDDQFRALSEVVDADGAHWFLTLPTNLGAARQRRSTRQPANGDWQFVPDGEGLDYESEVHDISPDGIGLLLAPEAPLGSAGRRIHGQLVRIDGTTIAVVAEVRNMRRHAHSPDWKVVGCALHLDAATREQLAMLIAEDA